MIVYLDTSCLAKIYVAEPQSEAVKARVGEADVVVTSLIAYPEMRSALARKRREGAIDGRDYQKVLRRFEEDWKSLSKVIVNDVIAQGAGRLAQEHHLRGFDAVHLATAVFIRSSSKGVGGPNHFLTSDIKLNAAAKKERFLVLEG